MGEQAELAPALLGSAAPLWASRPKVDFQEKFQCWEGPSQSLPPLRGQTHVKQGLRGKAAYAGRLQMPGSAQDPLSHACE